MTTMPESSPSHAATGAWRTTAVTNGHADASPSAASIWMKCAASVTLARGRQRKATPYTREGSAAHEVVELLIHGLVVPDSIEVEGESVEITEEMVDHVEVFVDYVDALRRKSNVFRTETRVGLSWLPEPIFGTADVLAYSAQERELEVVDLKFGKGVPVGADGNPQLRIYGLGGLDMLDPALGPVERVKTTIVQPRLAGGNPIQSETLPIEELEFWGVDVLAPAVQKIADGDTTEVPGTHCRWCVRAGECKALAGLAQLEARHAFSSVPEDVVHGLSNGELGHALDTAELIVAWVNLIRAEAHARLSKGERVPNWKVVAKRANRKWLDEEDAKDFLARMNVPPEDVTKIVSPAAVERVLKAHKLNPKAIADLVTRESSGTTLVRDEDAREGLALDAKSVFGRLA